MSCKGCAYAALLSGTWYCDYLSLTGHRRPCPPGEGCTVRKEGDLTKKGSAFMKRRGWDTEKAKALYDQKLSDAEIAGRVGTTASAVAFWRRGLGLTANSGQHSPPQEDVDPRAVPPPPAPPPSRPLALPAAKVIKCDREWAERVAWRIVKDWVEAQMAILESEMVQMDEIFLPYMLNGTGQTVFEAYRENQLTLVAGGCRL